MFSVLAYVDYNYQKIRGEKLFDEIIKQEIIQFDRLIVLQRKSLVTYVNDYSWWNDMVSYSNSKDINWWNENVNKVIGLYDVDISWIYDADKNLIIVFDQDGQIEASSFSIPNEVLNRILSKGDFSHNFIELAGKFIEITVAPIQSTDDKERTSQANGYLVGGRYWNSNFIEELSQICGAEITLMNPIFLKNSDNSNITDYNSGSFMFYKTVLNQNEEPLIRYSVSKDSKIIQDLVKGSRFSHWLVLFSMGIAIFICIALVYKWVTLPLNAIIKSLKSNSIDITAPIFQSSTEFRKIAELIKSFFDQKTILKNDIEEKKKTEKDLILARDKSASANIAKSNFLAMMSHETRTPMNAVIGFAEILETTKLDEEQEQAVKFIKTSSKSLLKLLNDILDFSRIEADRYIFERQIFDLEELIHSAIDIVSPNASLKNLELILTIEDDCPIEISTDADRLKQILIILLDNAVKFTDEGHIEIKVENVKGKSKQGAKDTEKIINKDVKLKISVLDTGIGIPENKLDVIFETFSQVDSSITRKYGGSGLGLSIAKRLAKLLNGDLSTSSNLGSGSSFQLTFTCRNENTKEVDKKENVNKIEDSKLNNKRVLIVDDDLASRIALKNIVLKLGFAADVVENGYECLYSLKENHQNIVFMDIHMPELDGFQTTERIRNELNMPNCYIIALTADAQEKTKFEIKQSTINALMIKPVNMKKIADALNEALKYGSE